MVNFRLTFPHAYRALAFTINGRGAAHLEKKILEDVKI